MRDETAFREFVEANGATLLHAARLLTGDYQRAASNFDRAIRAQPKDVPAAAFAKRASIFLFAKTYDEGLAALTQILQGCASVYETDLMVNEESLTFGVLPAGKSPFLDERVRQALSMSWDRDLWIDTFFNVPTFTAEGLPVESRFQ